MNIKIVSKKEGIKFLKNTNKSWLWRKEWLIDKIQDGSLW